MADASHRASVKVGPIGMIVKMSPAPLAFPVMIYNRHVWVIQIPPMSPQSHCKGNLFPKKIEIWIIGHFPNDAGRSEQETRGAKYSAHRGSRRVLDPNCPPLHRQNPVASELSGRHREDVT